MRAQMMFEVTACINIAVMVTTGVFLVLVTLRRSREYCVPNQHSLGVGAGHYCYRTELYGLRMKRGVRVRLDQGCRAVERQGITQDVHARALGSRVSDCTQVP